MVGGEAEVSEHEKLRKWLVKNLNVLSERLVLIASPWRLPEGYGECDILCRDQESNYVIIELKTEREIVNESVVSQILRYRSGLAFEKGIDPSTIRLLLYVPDLELHVRRICRDCGIGYYLYKAKGFSFPKRSIERVPSRYEIKHAIIPFTREGLAPSTVDDLGRVASWDVKQPVKWLSERSRVVAYYEKRLVGEAEVVRVVRGIKRLRRQIQERSNCDISQLLFYPVSLAHREVYDTLIFIKNYRPYDPPVRWGDVRGRIFGSKAERWYPRTPVTISDLDLEYIRGAD